MVRASVFLTVLGASALAAQSTQPPEGTPAFEVVSIRRNVSADDTRYAGGPQPNGRLALRNAA